MRTEQYRYGGSSDRQRWQVAGAIASIGAGAIEPSDTHKAGASDTSNVVKDFGISSTREHQAQIERSGDWEVPDSTFRGAEADAQEVRLSSSSSKA